MFAAEIKTTDVRARIESDLKESAQRVFAANGLTTSDAVRLFLRQVVLSQGIPFAFRIPNTATMRALKESEELASTARFRSAQELFNEIENQEGNAASSVRHD